MDREAFKRASIDWLLSVGDCEQMTATTMDALATLQTEGVDYERSDKPEMQQTWVGGDEFTKATQVKAYSAKIVPVGGDEFTDSFTFYVTESDVQNLLLNFMIRTVTAEQATGEKAEPVLAWQRRLNDYQEQMRRWKEQRNT